MFSISTAVKSILVQTISKSGKHGQMAPSAGEGCTRPRQAPVLLAFLYPVLASDPGLGPGEASEMPRAIYQRGHTVSLVVRTSFNVGH